MSLSDKMSWDHCLWGIPYSPNGIMQSMTTHIERKYMLFGNFVIYGSCLATCIILELSHIMSDIFSALSHILWAYLCTEVTVATSSFQVCLLASP